MSGYFEGTYYKHQKNGNTVCVISGKAKDSSFIQVITNEKSYIYNFKTLNESGCLFGTNGIILGLPEVKGIIKYSPITPIKYDIMGPFKLCPMKCRHKIVSMYHKLNGKITVEGMPIDFNGGTGYIEGDRGNSFPPKYLWVHCNDFAQKCSIVISVAQIPFGFAKFMGCIAVVWYNGTEYRFATYLNVKTLIAKRNKIVLWQGNRMLEAEIAEDLFSPLMSPRNGKMSDTIYESNTTQATFRLSQDDKTVFELVSSNTSFECEGL